MESLENIVKEILDDVKSNGDLALIKYSKKFDNILLEEKNLVLNKKDLESSIKEIPDKVLESINIARDNILAYHQNQYKNIMSSKVNITGNDFFIKEKVTPIHRVGVYVPGGRFSYPSTVLMTILPAVASGVKKIIVATPLKNLTPLVKATIFLAGADEVLCVGGAQAIAAMAFGTQKIKKVNMIVGPGNAFVTEAKRQVYGKVGIDMLAGPSNLLVFIDETTDLDFIAMDLMAQAEHDKMAKGILVAEETNKNLISKVKNKIKNEFYDRIEFYFKQNLTEIINFINDFAPEHLELAIQNEEKIDVLLKNIENAGAIFLGNYSPTAFGDYFFGPSHTLPTNSCAKFSSGLSCNTFLKRSNIMFSNKNYIEKNAKYVSTIAKEEGLEFHSESVKIRIK